MPCNHILPYVYQNIYYAYCLKHEVYIYLYVYEYILDLMS